MTRHPFAWSSVLLLAALAAAQDDDPRIVLADSPAPVVDGKLGDEAWEKAVRFDLEREGKPHGEGWMLRSGRQLYVGFRTRFLPLTLGVRLHVTDPATRRRVAVLVTPFDLPRPPLGVWLERSGGAEALDASRCDARFHAVVEEGLYEFELRLPLDTLQIGKEKKEYRFDAELWDTALQRPTAYYPLLKGEAGASKGFAVLAGEPDWGAAAAGPAPAVQGALALLHRLARRSEEREGMDPIAANLGIRDGRRRGEPLEEIDAQLAPLVEKYPDYAALRAQRVRVLAGLNRPGDALEVLRGMREDFPFLDFDKRHALAESQLIRESGRYADAISRLEDDRELLGDTLDLDRDLRMLEALREAHEAELAYRKGDEGLPRVSFETNRGSFTIELFEDDAPNAVASFLTLVESGFYDGTRFHWVTSNGAIFGGDPNSRDQDTFNDGFGGPGYLVETEPSRRLNLPMTVALADKRSRPRTQGSIFSINLTAAPARDTRVSVIGRIVEGFDVVKKIEYYDTLKKATIVRKRDHEYEVVKRP